MSQSSKKLTVFGVKQPKSSIIEKWAENQVFHSKMAIKGLFFAPPTYIYRRTSYKNHSKQLRSHFHLFLDLEIVFFYEATYVTIPPHICANWPILKSQGIPTQIHTSQSHTTVITKLLKITEIWNSSVGFYIFTQILIFSIHLICFSHSNQKTSHSWNQIFYHANTDAIYNVSFYWLVSRAHAFPIRTSPLTLFRQRGPPIDHDRFGLVWLS